MAQTLSKTGITTNSTIQAWHVTQSVDALTGAVDYDITISGSLTLTGSVQSYNGFTGSFTGSHFGTANLSGSFTGSLLGTADTASVAQQVKVTNNATTNQSFRLLFVSQTGLPNLNSDGYAQPRFDSGSDGSGLYYNPSTDTLNLKRISGSNDGNVDFFGTSSYAISASYAENATNATNFVPTFIGIDNVTYTASTNPYLIDGNAPFNVYVSQSATQTLGLRFTSAGVTSGKQINFVPQYQSTALNTNFIAISASGVDVYGINSNVISASLTAPANTGLGIGDVNNLTFQYIGTTSPPIFPTIGWYLINVNQS